MYTITHNGLAEAQAQPTASLPAVTKGAGWAAAGGVLMLLGLGGMALWLDAHVKEDKRKRQAYRLAWEREAAQRWT